MRMYPEALALDLRVAAVGIVSPEGTFLRTGQQLHRTSSVYPAAAEAMPAGGGALHAWHQTDRPWLGLHRGAIRGIRTRRRLQGRQERAQGQTDS
jgi:hypothetical protein